MLPNIVAPLDGWVTPLNPCESQEEFTAVDIYCYEVFGCFAFTTVTVRHVKRQPICFIRSEFVAFLACHGDVNIF